MLGFGENDPDISEGATDKMSEFPREERRLFSLSPFILSQRKQFRHSLRSLRVSKIPRRVMMAWHNPAATISFKKGVVYNSILLIESALLSAIILLTIS